MIAYVSCQLYRDKARVLPAVIAWRKPASSDDRHLMGLLVIAIVNHAVNPGMIGVLAGAVLKLDGYWHLIGSKAGAGSPS